jgi:plasmid stability protein
VATLIIRNVPDDTHRRLKLLAAKREGRASVEGLARSMLIDAAAELEQGSWVDRALSRNQAILDRLAEEAEPEITREELDRIFARQHDKPDYPDFSGVDYGPNE